MNKTVLKIISLILTAALTVGIAGFNTIIADAETLVFGDWEYEISPGGKFAAITGYNGNDIFVEIPSVLGGKPVAVIGPAAFKENTSICEVTFPSSVRSVRSGAFEACTSLEKVNLNYGIKEIHDSFKQTAIKSISIPSSVDYLSVRGFSSEYISQMIIEADNASKCMLWSPGILNWCGSFELIFKGIPKVEVDRDLRAVGYQFSKIGDDYCYKYLEQTDAETYNSGDYTYTLDSGEATVVRCNDFTSEEIIVPDTLDGYPVTAVGDFAFSAVSEVGDSWGNTVITYSYNYKKITLPESVKTIGRYAFAENKNLQEVILPEGLTDFNYCAFMNCKNLNIINIPDGIECLPDALFMGCNNLKTLELPDGIKTICDKAISITADETGAQFSVDLPDSVEFLGANLFENCRYAETVTLPKNLRVMRGTFRNMQDLKQVIFNGPLREIGDYTFRGCTGLEEISVPDTVTVLGTGVFYNCPSLKKAYLSENITVLEVLTFWFCTSLTELEWNAEKLYIEESAFMKCPLQSFDFSKTQSIDESAFRESGIEKAKIGQPEGDGKTKIGVGAQSFMSCSELQTVALGGNVDEVGSRAFADCEKLDTVIISDSVEKIAEDAFDGSDNVTIYCFANSYAEAYAIENKIKVTTLVISPIPNQTYTTKKIEPELTVSMSSQTLGENDYSAEYYNNINVGTANVIVSGKGEFDMLVSKADFAIVAKNIANVQISAIPSQKYDNTAAIKPGVTVKYNGVKLKEGTDYSLSYGNNHSVGTATVTIKGIGNYKGTATVNFEIVDEEDNAIKRFFNAIADFFIMAWNWFIGLLRR